MNILLFTVCRIPTGDAGSLRLFTFGKILRALGHNPTIVGMGEFNNYKRFDYDNVHFISLKSGHKQYLQSSRELLSGISIKIDMVFIYWVPLPAFIWLKMYAIKNKITLVHDSVEWYSLSQFGPLYRGYYEKNIVNRFIIDRHFKIIAISRYLENYYRNKGIKVTRVPVIMDMRSIGYSKMTPQDKIVLVYAGSPAKKDNLDIMIKALMLLSDEELRRIELRFIGLTHEQLTALVHLDFRSVEKAVSTLGRISRESVLGHLSSAHFTILFRDAKRRYAKAGFPTKFVESMATATPVILNLSSDLAEYIVDRENGIVIEHYSPEAVCKALRYILGLSEQELRKMQCNARKTAETHFDYSGYKDVLSSFFM